MAENTEKLSKTTVEECYMKDAETARKVLKTAKKVEKLVISDKEAAKLKTEFPNTTIIT